MDTVISELSALPSVTGFAILMLFFVLASFILRWFWKHVLISIARRTATTLDMRIFKATRGAAQVTFIAFGYNFSWNMFGKSIMENFNDIRIVSIEFIEKQMNHVGFLFLSISIFVLLWKTSMAVMDWFEHDVARKTESTLDDKIAFSARKIVKFIFIVVLFMIVADHYRLPISKLWAMVGIGSLAFALAAKDTIANMISGVVLLFDRPFLIGDRIELADGTFGDVIDIGIRSTKILSFDNTIHIVPNAELAMQRITNHTYPDIKLNVAHTLGVAYGSDMEKVKRVLGNILTDNPLVLKDPVWGIWFTEFADSSLTVSFRYWISDYHTKADIMDQSNMEIKRRFEEEGIEIPFPQRDVHIKQGG